MVLQLGKLEDDFQTEWPELDVYLTSVTDYYATISVCGPNSKKIIQKVTSKSIYQIKIFLICHLRIQKLVK